MATIDVSTLDHKRVELVTVNQAVVLTVSNPGITRITLLFETNAARLATIGVEGAALDAANYTGIDADRFWTKFIGKATDDRVLYLEPLTGNTFVQIIPEARGA